MLLAEGGEGALVGDVGLLEVGLQLGQLGLTLLVELDLGGGVGAGLGKAGAKVLEVP